MMNEDYAVGFVSGILFVLFLVYISQFLSMKGGI